MITIYSSEGEEYQPYKTIGREHEDCRERHMGINLMQWYVLEVLDSLRPIIQISAFYALVLWPVILYGGVN